MLKSRGTKLWRSQSSTLRTELEGKSEVLDFVIIKQPRIIDKNHIAYRETVIRMTADFSLETVQAMRQWSNVVNVLKEKNQPRILYPMKVYFKYKGERKISLDCRIERPILREMLMKQFRQKKNDSRWKAGLYEGMKKSGNGQHAVKTEKLFLI